eukprot:gene4528-4966_t
MAAIPSRDFFDLVKAIGESKSKQEEDRIITEEVIYLKKAVAQSNVPKKKMKEMVIRALYIEMLGQDASFAYLKSVELCASTTISQKRAGYLTAALFLSPDHEFRFMLVNQIQRDMKSTNMLEVTAALNAVCKLITEDMIPAVIGDVLNLLSHEMEIVRKKAVAALHRFYQMDKNSVLDHLPKIRRALCDKDPSVMGATLPLFQAMIVDDPMRFKDLVPSFVSILKQIIEHRLPREFDYHRIPAPWIQMNLVRVLALLGRGDQAASEGVYEVLAEVMKRADTGINVGYAVVYECINAVITIYPNGTLMDVAATAISRFIRSDSHNLKYIGIKALAGIVKDHPRYAADHQLAVIDCLEDPDETLKRKTLDLLFRMTNAVNVEFIVDKLLSFLASSVDDHFRSDLVNQISQCAERFAPSNAWYVQTIIRVFELAGDKVKINVAQTLTQLIAEGADEEEDDEELANEKDDELRKEAVENFLTLVDRSKLPAILTETLAWVLGEYGYLASSTSKEVIMDKLCYLIHISSEASTKATLVTALSKLIAQHGSCPGKVLQTISFFSQSRALDLQQRCVEVLALLRHPAIMVEVLPIDASCEDIDVDDQLSFLNDYVQKALNYGAKPYAVPLSFLEEGTDEDGESERKKQLKITPYAAPKMPAAAVSASLVSAVGASSVTPGVNGGLANASAGTPTAAAVPVAAVPTPTPLGPAINNHHSAPLSIATAQGNQLIGNRGVAQVWGRKPEPPPPPAPVPVPVPVPTPTETNNGIPLASPASASGLPHVAGSWGSPVATTSSPAPPAAAAVPAPVVPRVLTEKEKMAAALFGGVGGASSSGKQGSKRKSVVEPSVSVPTSPAPVPVPTPTVAPHSAETNGNIARHVSGENLPVVDLMGSMDLLGLDGHAAPHSAHPTFASPTPAAPVPVPSSSSAAILPHINLDEFELSLGSPSVALPPVPSLSPLAAPAPPSPAVVMPLNLSPAPSSAQLISDVFGGLDLTQPGAAAALANASSDFNMAPLVINTGEFGKRWGTTRFDTKQSIPISHWSRMDLEYLRRAIPPVYHHVESIPATQEAIFATTVTQIGAIVLLHCKVNVARRSCDIILKSSAQDVTQKAAQQIASAVTAFHG